MKERYITIHEEGDEDTAQVIRQIITHDLDAADRLLILMYADLHSLRELGILLEMNKDTAHREVVRVRQKIIKLYEKAI